MKREELVAKINEVLAEEFEVEIETITPEADIKETLDLDSLSLVDLVALIEETFKVEIKGQDIAKIKNFGALYDVILEKING